MYMYTYDRHIYYGTKNADNLIEPFFEVNIMLSSKDTQKLDCYGKYLQQKCYVTSNNSTF